MVTIAEYGYGDEMLKGHQILDIFKKATENPVGSVEGIRAGINIWSVKQKGAVALTHLLTIRNHRGLMTAHDSLDLDHFQVVDTLRSNQNKILGGDLSLLTRHQLNIAGVSIDTDGEYQSPPTASTAVVSFIGTTAAQFERDRSRKLFLQDALGTIMKAVLGEKNLDPDLVPKLEFLKRNQNSDLTGYDYLKIC